MSDFSDLMACENTFERLVKEDPARLLAWIESGELPPGLLSYAAESAGYVDPAKSLPVLMRLLHHHHRIVHEGAIYGIYVAVAEALQALHERTDSPTIKSLTSGWGLDDFGENVVRVRASAREGSNPAPAPSTEERRND